jgi:hypothetical protein
MHESIWIVRAIEHGEWDSLAGNVQLEAIHCARYRRDVARRVGQRACFTDGQALQVEACIVAIEHERLLALVIANNRYLDHCVLLISGNRGPGKQDCPNDYQVFLHHHVYSPGLKKSPADVEIATSRTGDAVAAEMVAD